MKKKIIVALGIATLGISTAAAAAGHQENKKNHYPDAAIVTMVSEEFDTVFLKDANGMIWSFKGVEDWAAGDLASLIMDDMGTPETILDDQIISARYSGYWDTKILRYVTDWEATETGLLLSFEDGAEYYIEK